MKKFLAIICAIFTIATLSDAEARWGRKKQNSVGKEGMAHTLKLSLGKVVNKLPERNQKVYRSNPKFKHTPAFAEIMMGYCVNLKCFTSKGKIKRNRKCRKIDRNYIQACTALKMHKKMCDKVCSRKNCKNKQTAIACYENCKDPGISHINSCSRSFSAGAYKDYRADNPYKRPSFSRKEIILRDQINQQAMDSDEGDSFASSADSETINPIGEALHNMESSDDRSEGISSDGPTMEEDMADGFDDTNDSPEDENLMDDDTSEIDSMDNMQETSKSTDRGGFLAEIRNKDNKKRLRAAEKSTPSKADKTSSLLAQIKKGRNLKKVSRNSAKEIHYDDFTRNIMEKKASQLGLQSRVYKKMSDQELDDAIKKAQNESENADGDDDDWDDDE